MSFLEIQGQSCPLYGQIKVQGSKNAILPMMAAMILNKGTTILTNVPHILDVYWMMDILKELGCIVCLEQDILTVDASEITNVFLPKQMSKRMRSSIILLGALTGRCKKAGAWYPGGCSIGSRPINIHAQLLQAFGASVSIQEDEISVSAPNGLSPAVFHLPFPSVGATENGILAAVCISGVTKLYNVAKEPEIRELCNFLNAMGANIEGVGTECLIINGGKQLRGANYRICGDRIVAATYLCAAAVCGGRITLTDIDWKDMESVILILLKCGCEIRTAYKRITLCRTKKLKAIDFVKTEVYPGFPTDAQSILMSVLTVAQGNSKIEETIFEGRFQTAFQLKRMDADITIQGQTAFIKGKPKLKGNDVTAMDLRGGAALIIAGLAAGGVTKIYACHHIFRGYETIVQDLKKLGASIRLEQE